MIFGSYPCCDGGLAIAVPDKTPAYLPESCPHCGAKVWHVVSRIDPISYTEADFLKRYHVDFETQTVTKREPPVKCFHVATILRLIARGILPVTATHKDEVHPWIEADGWRITMFVDCGDFDYVEEAITPNGQRAEFEDWMAECDREPSDYLTKEEMAAIQTILGIPGYLMPATV
jgi:hypothetical protein